jgi:hypothetical protein
MHAHTILRTHLSKRPPVFVSPLQMLAPPHFPPSPSYGQQHCPAEGVPLRQPLAHGPCRAVWHRPEHQVSDLKCCIHRSLPRVCQLGAEIGTPEPRRDSWGGRDVLLPIVIGGPSSARDPAPATATAPRLLALHQPHCRSYAPASSRGPGPPAPARSAPRLPRGRRSAAPRAGPRSAKFTATRATGATGSQTAKR